MQDFFVIPSPRRGRVLQTKQKKSPLKASSQMRFHLLFCDPCRIQTCNPHIRSVVLYSVELMDPERSPINWEKRLPPKRAKKCSSDESGCKGTAFF